MLFALDKQQVPRVRQTTFGRSSPRPKCWWPC